jgi:hypothetical protein
MRWSHLLNRSDLSAAATVTAFLIAGVLVKLGHAWWAIVIMITFCMVGRVIEYLMPIRHTRSVTATHHDAHAG